MSKSRYLIGGISHGMLKLDTSILFVEVWSILDVDCWITANSAIGCNTVNKMQAVFRVILFSFTYGNDEVLFLLGYKI